MVRKGKKKTTTLRRSIKREKQQPGTSTLLEGNILVVGDGDFSFSRGLVRKTTTKTTTIVATSYDTKTEIVSKYSDTALECIKEISRAKNVFVYHGVDGTRLGEWKASITVDVIPELFDRIVFNFPHSGAQRVHTNRQLLLDFFTSARELVTHRGEIHVSLKTLPPYSNWNIEEQASAAGLVIKDRAKFNISDFPGYKHCTTDPDAKSFEPRYCRVYQFVVNRTKYPVTKTKKVVAKSKRKHKPWKN